jgi:UDP-N-acetylmuramate--alanine ligase
MENKCHFIGIGGIGMSGLAKILLNKKISVSGSDSAESAITRSLHDEGAKIFIGQNERNIDAGMTVIYSSGIAKDNPEYHAAVEKKCSLIHRSELLQQIMSEFKTLAITGTHGKTTTTSLLAAVLHAAQLDPSFAVGGIVKQFGTNAALGKGEYFIAEADESDGTFLRYHPEGAIITNISLDHMDHFGTVEAVMRDYKTFANQVKNRSLLFWCGDDERLSSLQLEGNSYGFTHGNSVQGANCRQKGWNLIFDVTFQGKAYSNVELALTGTHNAQNALGIFGLAINLGISEQAIRKAFLEFKGVNRRCDKKGTEKSLLVLDDYAHHPKEINATLKAMRCAVEEKRLVVLFQPHRYSRTQDCLGSYTTIFNHADVVVVTDIYSAGEAPRPGVTSQKIIDEVQQCFSGELQYIPRNEIVEKLLPQLRPHDVVVTMGAGDITHVGGELLNTLKTHPLKKWHVGLVCGGRSVEHEISLRSAKFMYESLNPEYYDVSIFGITKEGDWTYSKKFPATTTIEQGQPIETIIPELRKCDVMFPALHGPYGEDGTIQGFFEMLDIAYVGCTHRAASIAMDKALTKNLMLVSGIPTSPFITVTQHDWLGNPDQITLSVAQNLTYPVYVKPVHLGSSMGVFKVASESELAHAIESALTYDYKLIIENEIQGREIEFSVLGNEHVQVFPPGEILKGDADYTYEAKYSDNSFGTDTIARVSPQIAAEGMRLAEKAFRSIDGTGMARIDFFLDKQNKIWLNEINPIPGFTSISLYPKMCAAHGMQAPALLDKLIALALQRKNRQKTEAVVA